MAEEKKEKKEIKEKKEGGGFNPKILIIGLPLFVVQLIAVYFITANFLMDKFAQNSAYENLAEDVQIVEEVPEEESQENVLYSINDLVVNPLNSRGGKLLLVSLSFELPTEDEKLLFASKDVIIKDKIISILSEKTQDELSKPSYKDTLKIQLSASIKNLLPDVDVNNIYFSKFIVD